MFPKLLSEGQEKTPVVQNDFCAEIGKHKTAKTKFRDFEFVPKFPVKPEDKAIFAGAEWERAEKVYEQCTNTEIKNFEIRRGLLKDDALIAVFSTLLNDREKILRWFQGPIEIAAGIVCVNLPFHGKIVSVNVDTKVPRVDGKPILSKPVRGMFPWSCFIEKALAKLLGSFSALERLSVKEILFHMFDFSSKTVLAPNVSDPFLEETKNMIKSNCVAFVTIGHSKDSEDAGLSAGSTYIVQDIVSQQKTLFVLLHNSGGKRRFISTFEERLDKWKQDAKFSKVKDDAFVFRSTAIQKYTQSVIVGMPATQSQFNAKITADIVDGQQICSKQFALKSDKFANINFIVECTSPVLHEITILEDGRLKSRLSTQDIIDFFTIRTDPEKHYTILFSGENATQINASLSTDSQFTTAEEPFVVNPLQQVGTGKLMAGKSDGRTPKLPSNVYCLPQWTIKLTEPGKLTFRVINKTICEARHYFFLAATGGEKLRTRGDFFYDEHTIEGNKDMGEWSVDIADVSKPLIFGCYRGVASINSSFDFEVIGEKPIELSRIVEFSQSMNNVLIEDKIGAKSESRSPLAGFPGVTRLRQYILTVDQPGKVFITFDHDEGKHFIAIQEGETRFNHFGIDHYEYFESDSKYDEFNFDAKPGSYVVVVTREPMKASSEYKLNFYSNAALTMKQMPSLSTENCHAYSRDIRFTDGEGGSYFPMETTEIPEKQYYLIITEPGTIIGSIETNSSQDDASYCIYIEDNQGKLIKEVNTTHRSEHAIGNREAKEWFTMDIKCEENVGTVLTFCVTKKGSVKRSSVAVRFFCSKNLQIASASDDLTEELKKDLIQATRESVTQPGTARRGDISADATKSLKDIPSTKDPQDKSAAPANGAASSSNCCLLI